MNAALNGFQKMFPEQSFTIEGVSVPSGVSEQPGSDEETFRGAFTRVKNAKEQFPHGDFWVGMEGGVDEHDGNMGTFAWIVVHSKEGRWGKGKTGMFFLPHPVAALVKQGHELGTADDIVFGDSNSKQKNGAIGLLTDNLLDRAEHYTSATIYALIPFKKPHLY